MAKERPIIFSGPMVKAILEGRKTQTRRVVKPQPHLMRESIGEWWWSKEAHQTDVGPTRAYSEEELRVELPLRCPFGWLGDRFWVRETFFIDHVSYIKGPLPKEWPLDFGYRPAELYYRADGECCQQIPECACAEVGPPPWRPSIHMPRWACRLILEVTEVRVERLQEISEQDARSEGVVPSQAGQEEDGTPIKTHRTGFVRLWNSLNEKRGFGWLTDPWVWVIKFKVRKEEG